MNDKALESAYQLLEKSIVYYKNKPIGTVAAVGGDDLAAQNYNECFIRDFVPSALVFLTDGKHEIVKNFLETVLSLRTKERIVAGHEIQPGVMPASFGIKINSKGEEEIRADFGERAIGRVAPVDSMMWWIILLYIYVKSTGDTDIAKRDDFQNAMKQVLHLCLKDSFEVSPALLVPDACTMIDRRMGIYGHPIEIQSLFYGILRITQELINGDDSEENFSLLATAKTREQALMNYVRIFYWLDVQRLNEIHRYSTEEFGVNSINILNIHPTSIPDWVVDWLPNNSGYLVGNIGASRMDFRYFSLGNLLAILFGLTTPLQSEKILRLYENNWNDLIGSMPLKICFPAMSGLEWEVRTGSDPKNAPWSYQNGGNWPSLLWTFVAAALKAGRGDLAERAYKTANDKLYQENWPEYYDSRSGRLIGRKSNTNQVWSATSLILSNKLINNPNLLNMLPS
ncbi:putative invertase [hydrothermal vent metagenome]|uniref:beta-fructofuranosidase n=1 Tax=hydrothermal vent metagenome TaxID=652676 RepID=A0A3B0ZI15_9ZZZZ